MPSGKFFFAALGLLFFCVTGKPLHAQNTIGIPAIVNYPKQVYNAGSQNWNIAQDKNGIVYFANNQGLLSFDGTFWRRYPLPNKTIVRSVAVDDDGRIYVGGQSEFGYFFPASNGELAYTSLMPLLPEKAKDFTDVWNICIFQQKIFFRAYRKIFEYDRKNLKVYDGVHWNFLGNAAGSLLAFEYNRGLVAYADGQWRPAARQGLLSTDINIKAAVAIGNDSTLLATLSHGLYLLHRDTIRPFSSPDIEKISGQNIYGAALLSPERIALVTNLSGCLIVDRQGKFVQRYTKKEGIQNNNILSLLIDRDKNLWLGLDNGIDLILYNNAIKTIFPEPEDKNAGYASAIHNHHLYLGLATGAYTIALDSSRDLSYTNGSFQPVQGSKGQVWNFSEVNGQLLMGHNSGAYTIEGDRATVLDAKTGFWDFQPLARTASSAMMIAGTYNGINFYNYANGSFVNPRIHAHFESARFVVQHGNTIWIAHPFKGLYEVSFTPDLQPVARLYADRNKVLSDNHNKIFEVEGRMVLTSDKGIFEYDDGKKDFVHAYYFEKLFQGPVNYIREDLYGNLWFCRDKKVGVVDRTGGRPKIVFIPELNNRIQADGFENILVIDSSNVLIAAEKGFFHLNYGQYKKNRYPLKLLIRNVRSIGEGDSLVFGGYGGVSSASLGYAYNSLHFEFSSTLFGQENTLEYSYYLDGFEKTWSEWGKKTEKDYTNIPPGHYVFKVRCRNNTDNVSPVASYTFSILPPWYRTWWAYALYLLAFGALLYFFYKRQQKKYKREQQAELVEQQQKYQSEQEKLQMEHELQRIESDRKIAQLENEKLQAEVGHKNSELASSAMNLVHKVEILSKIKGDLLQFRENAGLDKGAREFQKIIKVIEGELDHAQEWEQFSHHFDNVHTNYLKKLKDHCPDLTASELKLAAYLRLSLSTKEIAQLMNISTRGVETSRYRLRKKLGLTNDESNLYEFLIQITEDKNNPRA